MPTTISRWGNSLGVRLPKDALDRAHLHEGDTVSIELSQNGLLLRAAVALDIESLVSKITLENLHVEMSTGSAVGNEIW